MKTTVPVGILVAFFPLVGATQVNPCAAAQDVPSRFFLLSKTVDGRLVKEPVPLSRATGYFTVNAGSPERAISLTQRREQPEGLVAMTSPLLSARNIVLFRCVSSSSGAAPTPNVVGYDPSVAPVFFAEGIYLVLINDFNVQFKERSSEQSVRELLAARVEGARAQGVDFELIQGQDARYAVTFPQLSPIEGLELINEIAQQKEILWANPNFILLYPRENYDRARDGSFSPPMMQAASESCTPEPGPCAGNPHDEYPIQDHLEAPGNGKVGVNAMGAWPEVCRASGIAIGIMDDGVDSTHADLKVVQGDDLIPPWQVDDLSDMPAGKHGTAVAGLAAAITDNCKGVAGIAWGADIYPIRALGQFISSKYTGDFDMVDSDLRHLPQAFQRAVAAGLRVVNLSWSGGPEFAEITSAIDTAIDAGVVIVASAGNDGGDVNFPARLAADRDLIAVAATDIDGVVLNQGSGGWNSNYGPSVTVSTPAKNVWTTDLPGTNGYVATDYNTYFGETSAAAPIVAGAAALLLTKCPTAGPAHIKHWIQSSATVTAQGTTVVRTLNIAKAMEMAGNDPDCPTQ